MLEQISRLPALAYLDSLVIFSDRFLRYLETFRVIGDVYAVAEGTPAFALEPIIELSAPITVTEVPNADVEAL